MLAVCRRPPPVQGEEEAIAVERTTRPAPAGWNPNRKRGIIPMKTTQQKPTETAPPAAMPDTPPDHTYCLDMYENNDVSIDSYELTRAEFNTLKRHLAGLRGIAPAAAEPATEPTTAPQP